eukprot:1540250-Rhodomonas_salina.8
MCLSGQHLFEVAQEAVHHVPPGVEHRVHLVDRRAPGTIPTNLSTSIPPNLRSSILKPTVSPTASRTSGGV